MKIVDFLCIGVAKKGYFYPVTKSNSMTNSQVQELKALSLTDMECIQEALEDKVRATKKFLHEHIEPNKDVFPTLFDTYTRQLTDESDRLQRFNDCLSRLY